MRWRVHHQIALGFWALYLCSLFVRMIWLAPDGLWLGHEYLWSDWALHISMANLFAEKPMSLWFAYHPIFADGELTYPFLTNLISALFLRAGFSIPLAFIIPSCAFSILLVWGMHALLKLLLESSTKATLAVSIFFLSAGLGFWEFFADFLSNPSWAMLAYPGHKYHRQDDLSWLANNFIVGHLLPQRAFLLGMTIACWSMASYFSVLLNRVTAPAQRNRRLLLASLGAGLLPIVHMHSFIAMVILTGPICLIEWRRWRELIAYVIPAGLVSTALYLLFVHGGIQNPNFMSFQPAFGAKSVGSWLWLWGRAWGVAIPLAILGAFFLPQPQLRLRQAYFGSFLVLFILMNLIQFQPIQWDNSKLGLWVYFGLSGLSALGLAQIGSRPKIGRVAATVVGIMLTLSGVLELLTLQRIDRNSHLLINADEYRLGLEVRQKTHPLSRFLTDTAHNHPITVISARPILLGYAGWAWNFGFLYWETEKEIKQMYLGGDDAKALLGRHRISYVFMGPGELRSQNANQPWYDLNFEVAFSRGHYRIYDVRSTWKQEN